MALVTLLFACGGGGTTQSYQIIFDGTVSGLTSGQTVVLLASIPKTSQSVLISSSGGAFNSSITLPAPYTFSDAGVATVVVSSQPSTGNCTVSFVATTNILVVCTPTVTAAGFYSGTLGANNDAAAQLLILNDGSYWMWASNSITGNKTIIYSATGTSSSAGTSSGGIYKSMGGVDFGGASNVPDVGLSGSFTTAGNFSGQLTESGTSYPLLLSAPPASSYQFRATPSIASVAGNYLLGFGGKINNTLNVSLPQSGVFSGTTIQGCAFSATITPKNTGENIFNIIMNFGASPCETPNSKATGVIFGVYTTTGFQLWGGTIDAGNKTAFNIIASKI